MIKEEKKKDIINYYLDEKSIKKVIDKFNISKPTVYSILEDFQIPKPSELKNSEKLYASNTKSAKLNDEENGIDDDLGNDLKKLVIYSDHLVKYAKNLKEFTNTIQEMNNQRKLLQRINELIESTDLFELLKPETNQKQDLTSLQNENQKPPIIEPSLLLMMMNPNLPLSIKNTIITSKIFALISKMKPEDFNLRIDPNQIKFLMENYNNIAKNSRINQIED